jgi:hypothetical protein
MLALLVINRQEAKDGNFNRALLHVKRDFVRTATRIGDHHRFSGGLL